MRPNKRRCHDVTTSLIGWAHTQNDAPDMRNHIFQMYHQGYNRLYQYHGIYQTLNILHVKLFWWNTEKYISISHHFATLNYLNVWNHISWNTTIWYVYCPQLWWKSRYQQQWYWPSYFVLFRSATDEVIFHGLFELRPDFFAEYAVIRR